MVDQFSILDNVPSLFTTSGPMWSSFTVLLPLLMSRVVVGVVEVNDEEGRGRGRGFDEDAEDEGWFWTWSVFAGMVGSVEFVLAVIDWSSGVVVDVAMVLDLDIIVKLQKWLSVGIRRWRR